MKIAIIGSKGLPATYGGVENVVENLSKNYVKLGHEVTVYSRRYYSNVDEKCFDYNGVNVINIRGIKSKRLDVLSHSLVAAILVSFKKYDVIAFHSTVPGFFCVIPRLFGKKVFVHSHGLEIFGYKWHRFDKFIMKILVRLSSPFITGFSTVSYTQVDLCKKYYNRLPKLIPNGINNYKMIDNFDKKKQILFVGRIVPDKGVDILIDAFNKICLDFPDYKLVIVGEESYSTEFYKTLLDKASTNENIVFYGSAYKNKLIKLYKESALVVIPSLIESFSYVLLESLMYNGVVICSDIDQFKYLANGYVLFFKSMSVEDLSEKLKNVFKNEELYNNMRSKSLSFPFEEYMWGNISKDYIDFYNEYL